MAYGVEQHHCDVEQQGNKYYAKCADCDYRGKLRDAQGAKEDCIAHEYKTAHVARQQAPRRQWSGLF